MKVVVKSLQQRTMQYTSIISLGFYRWLILSLLLADNLTVVFSKPTTLRPYAMQERINGVPGLGRGYSTTTNTFHASCLNINGTVNEESYNYECEFLFLLSPLILHCDCLLLVHIDAAMMSKDERMA